MNPYEQFKRECADEVAVQGNDAQLARSSRKWMDQATARRYSYHFEWLGRPIIQYPQDITVIQELIWSVKPDLVIETGIAHGGSLMLSASLLALLDLCDATEAGEILNPLVPKRRVLGIDIDIRAHNRTAIEHHPLGRRIHMLQGASVEPSVVREVRRLASEAQRVMGHDH